MDEIEKYLEYRLDTRLIKEKATFHKKAGNTIVVYRWNDGMGYEANYKCLPYLEIDEEEIYIKNKFKVKSIHNEYCMFLKEDISNLTQEIKELTFKDEMDLEKLKDSCSEEDRNVANIMIYDVHPIGIYKDENLVGVCSVIKEDMFYDIGVLVHPLWRNKQIGSDLVKHMVKWIKQENGIAIYRVDEENIQSMKTAKKANFVEGIEVHIYELEK